MSAETENAAKNTPDDDDRRLCDEGGGGGEKKPSMHFIVQNVSKKHNIGTICRNCTAFDVTSMHLVGNAHYNVFGSHGSDAHVRIEHHPTLEECRETMKEKLKCAEILGVEITEESEDVSEYTFKGNTAFVLGMCVRYRSMFCCSIVVVRESFSLLFVFRDEEDRHVCMYVCVCVCLCVYVSRVSFPCSLSLSLSVTDVHLALARAAHYIGNEGQGMTPQQKRICDGFVYIKQYGPGTASLNVAVASSIVMHEFAKYYTYTERERDGEKFIVADKPLSRKPKGVAVGPGWTPEDVRKERELKRTEYENDDDGVQHVIGWD